ncbi:MAG TPA: UTP--glucose-1-phosphate uridylyltransferase GalU [Actinomycetota bacterium]|nr:UTP--glucose-1-phosphate uridylyltransferase GalU [Actinomycetota bacterium]
MPDVKVRKAVIPAAGLGTRFLPASKAQPKEMVPVVDKPAIQYVVEEAVRAGLEDILIVIGRGKYAIEDHFDRSWELEGLLTDKGDDERLGQVRSISDMAEIHYIRQKMPLGLGHAVSVAEQHVGDEPFAVMLGDDLIGEQENLLGDMVDAFNRHQTSVVAAMEVPRPKIKLYGAVAPGEQVEPGLFRLTDIIEKPEPERAPSNLAVIGRYVLHPEIFSAIRVTEPDTKGEIQLSDAMKRLVDTAGSQGVLAQRFTGKRYDVGEKNGYLRATVELAAAREDLGPDFVEFLREFVTGADGAEGRS